MPAARDDLVFCHGKVFDGCRFLPSGTCVRVRGGRITGVGPAEPLGPASEVDLAGGTLLPGFIDAHAHPLFAGINLRRCDLHDATNAAEYTKLIAAYARDHPNEEWILGGGWSLESFPGGLPDRQALDAVVSDRPVYLPNRDGHGAWVNSKALALAGIDRSNPGSAGWPYRARRGRRAHRHAAGGRRAIVSRLLPNATDEDRTGPAGGPGRLLSLGITGWQDAIVGRMPGRVRRDRRLPAGGPGRDAAVNVVGAMWWDRDQGLEQLPELLSRRARPGGSGPPA